MPTENDNTLIYVEKQLILPVAAKLVGSSLASGETKSHEAGFSWYVAAALGYSEETTKETRVAELFPEDIFRFCYSSIEHQSLSISELCRKVTQHEVHPPEVATLTGRLTFPDIEVGAYNPFDPPPIDFGRTYHVYGYDCFTGVLDDNGFSLPLYFLTDSADIVCHADGKAVEVVGVLKWSPSYEVSGYAMNAVVLVSALLLRR